MRESVLEAKCCRLAKAAGWTPYKFVSPAHRGVPDRMFLRNGYVFFVEFKALGETPTASQYREVHRLRANGFSVFVVDSEDEFSTALEVRNE